MELDAICAFERVSIYEASATGMLTSRLEAKNCGHTNQVFPPIGLPTAGLVVCRLPLMPRVRPQNQRFGGSTAATGGKVS